MGDVMDMYDRLDEQLKSKHMSRRQLAHKIEIPATTLNSAFSRKSKSLSTETIGKMARALNVPTNYLIGAQPFSDIEFVNAYKEYVLEQIADSKTFHNIIPSDVQLEDIDDNTYYHLIDAAISEMYIDEKKVVILFKPFTLNEAVEIETTPHEERSQGDQILYDYFRSQSDGLTNLIVKAFNALSEEGKSDFLETVKKLDENWKAQKEGGDDK